MSVQLLQLVQIDQTGNASWSGSHSYSQVVNFNGGFSGTISSNNTVNGQLTNSSAGTQAAMEFVATNNLGHNAYLGISGGSFTGGEWANGPTGEQVFIGGSGNIPVVFGSNNAYRGQFTGSGNWTINTPTSGTALTVSGLSGNIAIQATLGSFFQGQPSVCAYYMNSPGAAYGTIQNDSANTWSLGYTITSPSTSQALGSVAFQWTSSAGTPVLSAPNMSTGTGTVLIIDTSNRILKQSSSIRYKVDIEDLWSNVSNKVLDLRPIWYRANANSTFIRPDWSFFGLIAEEVANIEPRLVTWSHVVNDDPTTPLQPESIMYDRISVLLLNVVKEQEIRIKALEDALSKLNNKQS